MHHTFEVHLRKSFSPGTGFEQRGRIFSRTYKLPHPEYPWKLHRSRHKYRERIARLPAPSRGFLSLMLMNFNTTIHTSWTIRDAELHNACLLSVFLKPLHESHANLARSSFNDKMLFLCSPIFFSPLYLVNRASRLPKRLARSIAKQKKFWGKMDSCLMNFSRDMK